MKKRRKMVINIESLFTWCIAWILNLQDLQWKNEHNQNSKCPVVLTKYELGSPLQQQGLLHVICWCPCQYQCLCHYQMNLLHSQSLEIIFVAQTYCHHSKDKFIMPLKKQLFCNHQTTSTVTAKYSLPANSIASPIFLLVYFVDFRLIPKQMLCSVSE